MDKSPDAFRTISEVAELLETPAHVLRFWESRFPQIKPVKRAGGRRYYRPADVALLSGIRHLLHDEGMTIRGVQKVLRDQGVRHVSGLADDGGDDTLEDLDLAMDQTTGPEPDNVVALTEWRSAAEAGETQSALREALLGTGPDGPEPDLAEPVAPISDISGHPKPGTPGHEAPMVNLFKPMSAADVPSRDSAPMQWSLFDLDPLPAAPSPAPQEEAPIAQAAPPPDATPDSLADSPPDSSLVSPADAAPLQDLSAERSEPMSDAEGPAIPAPHVAPLDPAPLAPAPSAEPGAEAAPPQAELVEDLAGQAMPLAPEATGLAAPEASPHPDTGQDDAGPQIASSLPDNAAPESSPPPAPQVAPDSHPWLPPRLRALSQKGLAKGTANAPDLASLRALHQRAASLHARLAEANMPRRG